MLVINKIGPAKVKRVVLELERVVVRLVTGEEIIYRRVKSESNSSKKG